MNRDIGLKPRGGKELPPEKLFSIMSEIWGKDKAEELMEQLYIGQADKEADA